MTRLVLPFPHYLSVLLALLLSSLALAAIDPPGRAPISAGDTATLRRYVGQQITVRGQVTTTGRSGGSGHQFLNFSNRQVYVICMADDLRRFSGGAPADIYRGKLIEVTGVLEDYRGRLQLKLREPSQIRVVSSDSRGARAPATVPARPAEVRSPVLKEVAPDTWVSAQGVTYQGRDPEGRTRVEHIERHAQDMPDRDGSHGVFDGKGEQIFALIDEAWTRIREKKIQPQVEGDRSSYLVPFERRIGYLGGRAGARRHHPPLTRLFLVVETGTANLITAFPR